jgi:tetratricopeptide (TPR) repeat protein
MRQINLGQALELAEEARRLDRSNLEAALLVAELLAALGRGAEADRLLRAQSNADERVLLTRVLVKHLSHDYRGVLELWRGHPELKIEPAIIARALVQLRQLEEAREFIGQALNRAGLSNLDRAQLLYIQAFVPHFAADYSQAEAEFSRFLETLHSLDDGTPRYHDLWGGTHQLRAYARNALGRSGEALADSQVALEYAVQQGNGGIYAFRRSEQALYLLECGEFVQAEEVLHESQGVLERMGNPIYLARAEAIAARLYLDWGVPHGPALALRHGRLSLEYAQRSGEPRPPAVVPVWLIAAWVEVVHGRAEQALGLVDELIELARQTRQAAFQPAAQWVRGLALERLGQSKEAQALLQQALSTVQPMPFGPQAERMALELDRLMANHSAIPERLEKLRHMGLYGTLQVAERYFPWLTHREAEPVVEQKTRLEVLGPMTVGGAPLSERTRKGKELLALLLEARLLGRGGVGQLELIDQIYPELDEDKALAALKQLVYRLRITLDNGSILRKGDGYALGALSSDAEEFLSSGELGLWRGVYLEDLDQGLGGNAREVLYHSLQTRASEQLSSDPQEVLRIAQIMLQADLYDEGALALALQANQLLGNPKAMHELYRQARTRLAEVGERLPDSAEVFLQRRQLLKR